MLALTHDDLPGYDNRADAAAEYGAGKFFYCHDSGRYLPNAETVAEPSTAIVAAVAATEASPEVDDRRVMLRMKGSILHGAALVEAKRLAKLGIGIELVDPTTGAVIQTFEAQEAKAGGKSGGGSIERDERGLTTKQAIFVDMAMRPAAFENGTMKGGATNKELVEAGATTGTSSISWQYVADTVTIVTKGRFVKGAPIPRIENGRATNGFTMIELPEEDRAAALAKVEAAMAAKGQRKAADLKMAAD